MATTFKVIQGLNAERPAWSASYFGQFYAPTDDNTLWLATVSRWKNVSGLTLAQIMALLTAENVSYVDNEGIGATNVQDAIDWLINHRNPGPDVLIDLGTILAPNDNTLIDCGTLI